MTKEDLATFISQQPCLPSDPVVVFDADGSEMELVAIIRMGGVVTEFPPGVPAKGPQLELHVRALGVKV